MTPHVRPLPAVFLYGGSWKSGDRAEYAFVAEAFTSRGFVVVIADYRFTKGGMEAALA